MEKKKPHMKRLATLLALVPLAAAAETTTWNIDPSHTQSMFTVRHMVITNVQGQFDKTTGTVRLDDQDVTRSSVEATIDAASVNTRVANRDADLRSQNFFEVAKYPTITFKSTKVEKAGEGKLKVTGELTMHGVTRPVVLEVEGPTAPIKDPQGKQRRGLDASTTVNRKDFGLTWNKMVEAGPVVGDQVKIEIQAEIVAAGEKQEARD
jgi:polyisoprenoid-binding protein YceI